MLSRNRSIAVFVSMPMVIPRESWTTSERDMSAISEQDNGGNVDTPGADVIFESRQLCGSMALGIHGEIGLNHVAISWPERSADRPSRPAYTDPIDTSACLRAVLSAHVPQARVEDQSVMPEPKTPTRFGPRTDGNDHGNPLGGSGLRVGRLGRFRPAGSCGA